ncbi:MAG: caa(3)-type oxidase subunit IV [Phenylobacterium sp.]|uniref:cytochrome C oxidase subunit IV family protein n=1 Tax=Phenylobacterium sp. TaxID=1871053 RepID=UPI0025CCB5F5|nr:cytochrome C oxidase subunit IV family protein [Phenylobacterium sp.]MBI1200231.1 caa(3)-type oxidase subunit IV [Phenylobacterium sp.]
MSRETTLLVAVWAALMLLLAATVAATFAPLGALKPVLNLGIAFAKASLVFWVFMHLREQPWLARLAAVAAVAWLLMLIALTQADLMTRSLF